MESTEQPSQEYDALSDDEKLNAILGAIQSPISKERAIQLSGINYASLDDEQRIKLNSVFSQKDVETTEEKGGVSQYILGEEARQKLSKKVDMVTVHRAIAKKKLEEIYGKHDTSM
jgi:hypothetical protein